MCNFIKKIINQINIIHYYSLINKNNYTNITYVNV